MSRDLQVAEIAARPYRVEVSAIPEEDGGGYYARFVEFRFAAHGDGATPEEAIAHARKGLETVLHAMIEEGDVIPEPLASREYSGKFNVRVPKSLHRALTEEAEAEGVSLNMLIVSHLSKAHSSAGREELSDQN